MNPERPKIGIVSLGEAGNLGDDLILIAVVDAIYSEWPYAEVSFLSFGQEMDWDEIVRTRGYVSSPSRVRDAPELPILRENRRKFDDRDAIVFGGGGLLQTSHSPDRPYEWLSFLPTRRSSARVIAVGLGVGPLADDWISRLAHLGSPFDAAWIRDPDSLTLTTAELDWPAQECRDFIDSEFLASIGQGSVRVSAEQDVLGVALRAWPGLSIADVSAAIQQVAIQHGCDAVEFFVLEAAHGDGVDVRFTQAVAEAIDLRSEVVVYDAVNFVSFVQRMFAVKASVSMKLHSSAIWSSVDIPIYPIYYAPKVSAFFGLPHHGLEISDRPMKQVEPVSSVPRAARALVDGITFALPLVASGSRFSLPQRFRFQVRRLARALRRRVRSNRWARR